MQKTFLITGASGGMIGAAYYRELYLQKQNGISIDLQNNQWLTNIGKDNLNSIIFSLVVNDAFFGLRKYSYNNQEYSLDRGYVFERNLNSNLEGILDKKLFDYEESEKSAMIPTMIFSPVIANDGRKLFISASPVSFMSLDQNEGMDNLDKDNKDDERFYFRLRI